MDGITVKTFRNSEQDTSLMSNKPSPDFGELLLQEGADVIREPKRPGQLSGFTSCIHSNRNKHWLNSLARIGIKTVVMAIFVDLRGNDSFKCL